MSEVLDGPPIKVMEGFASVDLRNWIIIGDSIESFCSTWNFSKTATWTRVSEESNLCSSEKETSTIVPVWEIP